MRKERVLIVGCASVGAAVVDHLVSLGLTADLIIEPPRIDIEIRPQTQIAFPEFREVLREPKKRDWEQRQKRRRRK